MAALDDDHLVVRVVYTGPPLAGKTQSVRALMPLLRGKGTERAVVSPGEWRGRTAFFDWADYEGGTYEGKPIRCQILSTPGQVALSDRRELLLRAADAVIMVVDSQEDGLERATQCYEEMAPWLAEAGRDAPIRLSLQCNKQDLPHAVPPEELSRRLGLPVGKDVYATSATTGSGLRAAFVGGVRNAVERARALVAKGIVLERPDAFSGQDLFERMRREVAPLGSFPPQASVSDLSKSNGSKAGQSKAKQPGTTARAASPPTKTTAARSSNAAAGAPGAAPASARPSTTPSRSGLFPASTAPLRRPDPAREATSAAAAPGTRTAPRSGRPAPTSTSASASTRAPAAAGVSAPRGSAGASVTRPKPGEPVPAAAAKAADPARDIRRKVAAVTAVASTPVAAPSATGTFAVGTSAMGTAAAASAAGETAAVALAPARRDAGPASSARRAVTPGAEPEPVSAPEGDRAPARQVVDPHLFGLETSAFVDEPSESFGIPESPPGLQALLHPSTEPASPRTEPGGEAAAAERPDSMRVSSLAAAAGGAPNETPPFSLPGPRLPGQVPLPRAVWRRACWRALENQLSASASALRDARGRWLGELAPGWFARTLRNVPDERAARRAFAQQVLRERQLAAYLSRPRCCMLTEEANGFWIWQVACRVPTLATILRPRLAASEPPSAMADALLDAALGYLDARQRFVAAKVPLPLSPHALSFQDGRVVYSGLMPDLGAVFIEPAGNGYAAFQDALRKMRPDASVDGKLVLAELESKAGGRIPEPLLGIIREVVDHR